MANKLRSLFNIEVGEGRLVSLLLLQYFCMGMAFTFVQTTAFTLFLTEFNAQTLSWAYIAMAVILILLTFSYLYVSQRVSFPRLLSINLGTLLIFTVFFGIGLAVTQASWLIFALPVLFQIILSFGNLAFWSLAGRLFNVRQGKRLFGLVGAGQWFAVVITGFLMPTIVAWLGLANLLWLGALSLIVALALLLIITRQFGGMLATPSAPGSQASQPGPNDSRLGRLLQQRYVQLIFALTLAWWLCFFFLDNIFYGRAAVQYTNPAALAGFLGSYLGGLAVLTLISNFFISGRIIGRYGLRVSLLILPIGLAIGTAIMTGAGALAPSLLLLFWATVVTKVWDMAVGLSIDLSARTILYQPLPAHVRIRVQTLTDGVVQPLAIGLAGIALLALNAFTVTGPLALIVSLLVVLGALLVIAVLIGREYAVVLTQALAKRRLTGTDLLVNDAASMRLLQQGLQSSHPSVVVYSAQMLEGVQPTALIALLPKLLVHEAPDVRRDAFERTARLRVLEAVPVVQAQVQHETTPELKGLAIRTLAQLGGAETLPSMLRFLDDPQPQVRSGAVAGLLANSEGAAQQAAQSQLHIWATSLEAADRGLAAQILGECHLPSDDQLLIPLISDPDLTVRRTAIRSVGQHRSPHVWAAVLDACAALATRSVAAAALIAGGADLLPQISAAIERFSSDRDTVAQLIQVCGRIRQPAAISILKPWLNTSNADLRSATLRALTLCGYRIEAAERSTLQHLVQREIEQAAWLLASAADLGASSETQILQEALADQLTQSRERVLLLLGCSGDTQALQRAWETLLHGPIEKKAYALEVIDIQTPRELKASVLALVDEIPSVKNRTPPPTHTRDARLRELALNVEQRLPGWVQAYALSTANICSLPEVAELAGTLLDAPDQLLRETAGRIRQATAMTTGDRRMLSTIERVICLKAASIFAETSHRILVEVAAITTEIAVPAGSQIFAKGDPGDSMYIITAGRVRVQDGGRILNDLVTGNVFGEMAVLDREPRSASVLAIEDTQLLRLDQQALYDLIDDRPEVARGLLQVLSQHLRERMRDLAELRERVPEPNP